MEDATRKIMDELQDEISRITETDEQFVNATVKSDQIMYPVGRWP